MQMLPVALPSTLHHRRVLGPEDLIEAISNAEFAAKQLAPSSGASVLERVFLAQTCLDAVQLKMPVHFQGVVAPDAYTLIFVDECPTPGRALTFSVTHQDGYIGFFPPGKEIDAFTPVGYSNISLCIPCTLFLSEVDWLYPEIPDEVVKNGAGVRLSPEDSTRIRDAVRDLRQLLGGEGIFPAEIHHICEEDVRAAFMMALSNALARHLQHAGQLQSGRLALLRKAIDCIHYTSHQVHVSDLCRETRMSRRTLENLFRELLDTSPSQFIRATKLHEARRQLLHSEPTSALVKQAAFEAGFQHMGHFAQVYRDIFGELPKETLQRARGCHLHSDGKSAVSDPVHLVR